jgi:hypothetical protein
MEHESGIVDVFGRYTLSSRVFPFPKKNIQILDQEYSYFPCGRKEFLGCYDWLRDPDSKLVGFRLWVDPFATNLLQIVPNRKYVTFDCPEVFRVNFRPSLEIDEESSMVQDFGKMRAFRSASGGVTLSVDAEELSSEDWYEIGAYSQTCLISSLVLSRIS